MTQYEEDMLGLLMVIATSTTIAAIENKELDATSKIKLSDMASGVINDVFSRMTPSKGEPA